MSTSGGSGGGGVAVTFAQLSTDLTVNDAATTVYNIILYGPNADGAGPEFEALITSLPFTVPALTAVINAEDADVAFVDTTSDVYIVAATITVSNAVGTEVLQVTAETVSVATGPNETVILDWSTATTTAVAGTDLSWNGTSVVSSTAGGVFAVSMQLNCGPG